MLGEIYRVSQKKYSSGGGLLGLRTCGEVPLENLKSYTLSRVKFLKMIPCTGVKFTKKIPYPLVSSDKIVLCKEICTKSIEKCGNIAIHAI